MMDSIPVGSLTSCFASVFRCFYPVFFHIQMLWELVLLGEALVVMAPSPAESSDTVLALVRWAACDHGRSWPVYLLTYTKRYRWNTFLHADLWPLASLCSCISPLRCCSDFRPYFTIHDSEFKEYTTRTQAPSVILLFTCCCIYSLKKKKKKTKAHSLVLLTDRRSSWE